MDAPNDTRAKNILDVMLDDLGVFEREYEVPALRQQRGDVRFDPSPKHTARRRALGLLGAMTEVPCLFEPNHEAPSRDDVEGCLRKLLNARHAGVLDPRRRVDRLWLLCGGRPDDALTALRARPMRKWPRGFYELAGLGLSLVVLSELPLTDDTLALRLMGAGTTRRDAIDELRRRHSEVPRGAALFEAVVQELADARRRAGTHAENLMVDLTEARALLATARNEGLSQGLSQGLSPLARQFARKLGRPLDAREHETLTARLHTHGSDRLGDVALDLDGPELSAWLADPKAV